MAVEKKQKKERKMEVGDKPSSTLGFIFVA